MPGRGPGRSRLGLLSLAAVLVLAFSALLPDPAARKAPSGLAHSTSVAADLGTAAADSSRQGGGRAADASETANISTSWDPAESLVHWALDPPSARPADFSNLIRDPKVPLALLFGLKVRTIVVDPGHGGSDPGAIGPTGLMEKEVTLDIARRLRDRLWKSDSHRVLLTREEDEKLSLRERVDFARASDADLFVSIHVNSLPVEPLTMVETYYFGPYGDERTLELAERENEGSGYRVGDFRALLEKIGVAMKTQESKSLATSIQRSLYRNIKLRNKNLVSWGIKTAPFVVLLGVDVPSVLTEVSCISNREEEQRLASPEYREMIAQYLEHGIVEYLHKMDNQEEVPSEGVLRYAATKNQ
jgi:N-acetylmuramoyl-L-alanine amidase